MNKHTISIRRIFGCRCNGLCVMIGIYTIAAGIVESIPDFRLRGLLREFATALTSGA